MTIHKRSTYLATEPIVALSRLQLRTLASLLMVKSLVSVSPNIGSGFGRRRVASVAMEHAMRRQGSGNWDCHLENTPADDMLVKENVNKVCFTILHSCLLSSHCFHWKITHHDISCPGRKKRHRKSTVVKEVVLDVLNQLVWQQVNQGDQEGH